MPVAVPLIAAGVAAGATVYSVHEQRKTAEEASDAQARLAKEARDNMPKAPNTASYATDQQRAQALAMSAGVTLLSDHSKNRTIGTDPNVPRKTLLGA